MAKRIEDLKKGHDRLICIDSDGCLLDNMELKHKECFCPAFVTVWELQAASRYAREVWEFVNLYSRTRGMNRFPALVRALDLFYGRSEVRERGLQKPDISALRRWTETTDNFSEAALSAHIESFSDGAPEDLERALQWSREVNRNVAHTVRNIGPFPGVFETLTALKEGADLVVVSSTPEEALVRELTNCGLIGCFDAVAGQESGTKAACIEKAMAAGFKKDETLKVGDAPGDLSAAEMNGCLFFPIVPGREAASWSELRKTGAPLFLKKKYEGPAMQANIGSFLSVLPEEPVWR